MEDEVFRKGGRNVEETCLPRCLCVCVCVCVCVFV